MDQPLWTFLGLVVAQIAAIAISYMKSKSTQKNSIKELIEAQKKETIEIKKAFKEINERLDYAENKQVKQEEKELSEKILIDAMIAKSFSIISANSESLDNEIRAILNATEQKVTKFAINQRNSPYRKGGEAKWREYLLLKSGSIQDQIKVLANDIFTEKKDIDGEVMDYDQFIYHTTTIKTDIAVIMEMLVKNGLDEDQYTELFVRFIEVLFKQQMKGWRKWKRL